MERPDVSFLDRYHDLMNRKTQLSDGLSRLRTNLSDIQQNIEDREAEIIEVEMQIDEIRRASRVGMKREIPRSFSPTRGAVIPRAQVNTAIRPRHRLPNSHDEGIVSTNHQVFSRPGLKKYDQVGKSAKDFIKSTDHVVPKLSKGSLMLHKDLPMIVKLPDGWNEIWCHVCGANAADHNIIQGLIGMHSHIRGAHPKAGEPWSLNDVLNTCGRQLLTPKEVRDLRQWKVTVNILRPAASGRPRRSRQEITRAKPDAQQSLAVNDVDDEEIMNYRSTDEDEEDAETPEHKGRFSEDRFDNDEHGMPTARDPVKTSRSRGNVASAHRKHSTRSSSSNKRKSVKTSSAADDDDHDGVADRIKKRRLMTLRHTYKNPIKLEDEEEEEE